MYKKISKAESISTRWKYTCKDCILGTQTKRHQKKYIKIYLIWPIQLNQIKQFSGRYFAVVYRCIIFITCKMVSFISLWCFCEFVKRPMNEARQLVCSVIYVRALTGAHIHYLRWTPPIAMNPAG